MRKVKQSKTHQRLRISHSRHNFKRLPKQHTSYALLVFIIIITGILLAGVTFGAHADLPPEQSSYGIAATVPGPVPTIPAIIVAPGNGQRVTDPTVPFSGSCQPNTEVRVTNGDVFAGATPCNPGGRFNLSVHLFQGANVLTALNFDIYEQAGPNSQSIVVYYNPPITSVNFIPAAAAYPPLVIATPDIDKHGYIGDEISWKVHILGGKAPYAFKADWGDGKTDLITVTDSQEFIIKHIYKSVGPDSGTFIIIFASTDAVGSGTFIQLPVAVDARGGTAGTIGKMKDGNLGFAWPALAVALILVIFFWLGEKLTEAQLTQRLRGVRG